jgi:dynein heavy chain
VLNVLVKNNFHTLLVGNTGTGKTALSEQELDRLPETHSRLIMCFSSATSSNTTQDIIESCMEKRSKDKFGPSGGKRLVCFIDDLNMPTMDTFGSQPPLELLRQWVDYGCWYDRQKQLLRYILDTQLVCAMGPPGGGRSVISERLQSRFNVVNFTAAHDSQLQRIFEFFLQRKLVDMDEDIKPMSSSLVSATIKLYNLVVDTFLPTPEKCHYLFNMRDMSKIVQGCLKAHRNFITSREQMIRLWVHECQRVFCDRLINFEDIDKFKELVSVMLSKNLDCDWGGIMGDCALGPDVGPCFQDLSGEPGSGEGGGIPYEEVLQVGVIKQFLEEQLEDYNVEPGYLPMNLVLFKDAMAHCLRIARILKTQRGNALLVGVGGSGRQSMTRLAAFCCEMKVFTIEITKNYRSQEFHDDLRKLYGMAAIDNLPTVFLFNDTQIKQESFLEDVNNILSSGVVPGLFADDDKVPFCDAVREAAKKDGLMETADVLWDYAINRVRDNLHVVLCMSPIGSSFSNRCRMFPGLVNCTTIDWFQEWPQEALKEVAAKFLEEDKALSTPEMKLSVANVFASAHGQVVLASELMKVSLERINYVTPTSYLELVKGYQALLKEKQWELLDAAGKLKNGVGKLVDSKLQVEEMSVELEAKKITVAKSQKDCE